MPGAEFQNMGYTDLAYDLIRLTTTLEACPSAILIGKGQVNEPGLQGAENIMKSGQEKRRKWLPGTVFLTVLIACGALNADRILVVGDSWARDRDHTLREVVEENGHTGITVTLAPSVWYARELAFSSGLEEIAVWLNTWPDTKIVHLSIGGNDLTQDMQSISNPQEEAAVINKITTDVAIIVDHFVSIRPDIQILWSSYDFFRPIGGLGTPYEVNSIFLTLTQEVAKLTMSRASNFAVSDINGLLQVTYGFDGVQHSWFDPGVPIPPGDPSLPDPRYPSPIIAFKPRDVQHLTEAGYKVLAQAQYDEYYGPLLDAQPFEIDASLNGNWWNGLARNGEGVQVEVSDGGDSSLIFVATIYSYDMTGNQIFLIAVGTVNGDTVEVDVFITEGGLWGDGFDPTLVMETQWGTGTFSASGCEAMQMELRPNAEHIGQGYTDLMYDLIRLTTSVLPCPIENRV